MTESADEPHTGFYQIRMVRGGIFVPVKVWFGPPADPDTGELLDRSWRWQALRNGDLVDVNLVWPFCARFPIDQNEYDYLLARKAWAEQNAPDTPEAQPKMKIDLLNCELPF